MKLTAMMTVAAVMGIAVQSGQSQERLAVFVQDHTAVAFQTTQAQMLAEKMFATIGITLEWHHGKPPADSTEGAIAIELADRAPLDSKPGTLAYARPYEGVYIKVFYHRIAAFYPNGRSAVLAHVMVHEITHILEGISRHSDSGIMKANWTADDYCEMRFRSLPFAPEDVSLIRLGMEARANRIAAALNAKPSR